MLLENLRAYFARRLPTAQINTRYFPAETGAFELGDRSFQPVPSSTVVTIRLPLSSWPACRDGIAFGALRRATPSVQPIFYAHAGTVLDLVGDNPDHAVWRHDHRRLADDEEHFAAIVDMLLRDASRLDALNTRTADAARAHPVNVHAMEQVARQAAVLAHHPTAEVDRFLAERMGYSYERQAGWGPSTRTKRRKEARQVMSGKAAML